MLKLLRVLKMKITDLELNINLILSVQKGKIPPSTPKCAKRHSDCFVYVLSGEAEYIFNNKPILAQAGNIIYLAHNSSYSINVTDDNYTFIYMDFIFENDKNIIFENEIYKSKGVLLLEKNFEKLHHFWCFGNYSDKIYCKSLIYNIYSEIAKSSVSQYVARDRRNQIENIAEYISDNLSDNTLNISQLSKMCNISEVHFRRIFSSIYHISPIKFITTVRINKAKELLVTETYNISEIAEMCGFQNHYYFSKIFKSETKMTPAEFRKHYKVT